MTDPLISVVLTTYNRCHLLPRAIHSVLSGSYANFELIIMDDASTDETSQVVAQLRDYRIRYVRLPENGGVLRARNRAFDLARGEYITILDDDDELAPDALATVADEFRKWDLAGVDVLWFDCRDAESGQRSGSMPHSSSGVVDFRDLICGRIHGDFWLTFSKEALQHHRFNEKLKAHESLLWMRVHRTHQARYVPRVLCSKYRAHGGERLCDLSVRMRQLEYTTLALSLFIEEFGEVLLNTCPSIYGSRLAYLGLHQMAVADFASGRASILRSLRYRFALKYLLLYVASYFISPGHVVALIARAES